MALTIASLPVSGGTLALCPMPGRDGRYAADMAELLAFAPALVFSMTTAAELSAKGAAGLPKDLAAKGVLWQSLPIADFGTPDQPTAALWPAAAALAHQTFVRGGKVLIHCMGGCGRSGMAALRLMVEAGESPGPALARLRAVRPCAVETDAQFEWAAEGAGSNPATPTSVRQ